MSREITIKLIKLYEKFAPVSRFLTGFFQSPPDNYYDSEEVEINVVREDEDVAIAVQSLSAGWRYNSSDGYTVKKFAPPIYKEAFPIDVNKSIKTQPGRNPYEDPEYVVAVLEKFIREMAKLERKINRSIEIQASQLLTTGKLNLTDENGVVVYTLDFKPKSSHFVDASNPWDGASAAIEQDLMSLCNQIRDDSLEDPVVTLWNESAWYTATKDDDFYKLFEARRLIQGEIAMLRPRQGVPGGGQFRGIINIGNYPLEVWTYNGRYKDPQTGVKTLYIPKGKVIVKTDGVLDKTFGGVPAALPPDQRVIPFLNRISIPGRGSDFFPWAWASNDGMSLFGGVASRPLLIPTDIDSFGCIDAKLS